MARTTTPIDTDGGPSFELHALPGVDIDRARHLAAALEDEAVGGQFVLLDPSPTGANDS